MQKVERDLGNSGLRRARNSLAGPLEFVAVAQQILHARSKALLNLGDVSRVSSAEHQDLAATGEGNTQVVRQPAYA